MDENKRIIDEELKEVTGGTNEKSNGGYFRCTNPKCWRHNSRFSVGVDECPDCGSPFEWVER